MSSRNSLLEEIKDTIKNAGDMSFCEYMHKALYHPKFGYYTSKKYNIGAQGDFYTAPEISPLFGASIAKQISHYISEHGKCDILEVGPGTGSLAKSILQTIDHSLINQYYLLEISTVLIKKQQNTLSSYNNKIVWTDVIPENFQGVIIANEVLDAMPVHRFRNTKNVAEQYITLCNENLASYFKDSTNSKLIKKVKELEIQVEGYESEINLNLEIWLANLAKSLLRGIVLIIDYGYSQDEYYTAERNGGTLTCFIQQKKHNNPLINVGIQDISTHVDFTSVAKYATANKLAVIGFCEQSHFLMNLDILTIASSLYEKEPLNVAKQLKILLMPNQMGSLCKVMALSKNIETDNLTGFTKYNKVESLFYQRTK